MVVNPLAEMLHFYFLYYCCFFSRYCFALCLLHFSMVMRPLPGTMTQQSFSSPYLSILLLNGLFREFACGFSHFHVQNLLIMLQRLFIWFQDRAESTSAPPISLTTHSVNFQFFLFLVRAWRDRPPPVSFHSKTAFNGFSTCCFHY